MERETVIEILLFFRDIEKEISLNTRILKEYEERYYNTRGNISLDGVPRNKYKISNPTEAAAINIPDSISAVMRELRKQNERLDKLKNTISGEINSLPSVEKNIVYDFHVKGLQWVQISLSVNYSERQCRNICNRGLDNLGKQFSKNALIKKLLSERYV